MLVEQCMKRPVQTMKPRDSIQHAREKMESLRVNQLPVVRNGELVGIITDRDLRDAYPSVFEREGHTDPSAIPVEDVMTQNVVTIAPGESAVEAARLMLRERFGAIPVVDDGRVVGIVTRADMLAAILEMLER